jgi:hypothetical protein
VPRRMYDFTSSASPLFANIVTTCGPMSLSNMFGVSMSPVQIRAPRLYSGVIWIT